MTKNSKWVFLVFLILCAAAVYVRVVAFRSPAYQHKQMATAQSPRSILSTIANDHTSINPTTGSVSHLQGGNDWNAEYAHATDGYSCVELAAPKALAGDGRASVYVAEVLRRCAGVALDLEGSSVETKLLEREAQLAAVPNLSGTMRATILSRDRVQYAFCQRFAGSNAFAALPTRDGGYKHADFWQNLAYQAGDSLALADHAASNTHLPNIATDPSSASSVEALDQAQKDLNRAVATSDPAALFEASAVFVPPTLQTIPNQNLVLMLASCNLGYDCTASNPRLAAYFDCTSTGACAPGYTMEDFLKSYLGSASESGYAQVYAAASNLTEAVKQGDRQAIERYLTLKH